MKEAELRERLLLVLPSLRHPTFRVVQAQFSSRLSRGLLDRTLRHMISDGVLVRVVVTDGGVRSRRYVVTQDGFTERARVVLSRRALTSSRS